MPDYKVKQGDCISSIAQGHGIPWEKIWNHPKNANLQQTRKDPNVLYPGDLVSIPEKEEKQESGATERRHRFHAKGSLVKIRVRFTIDDQPRANEPYKLEIEGRSREGTTDGDGYFEENIPASAKGGKLIVGEANSQDIYEFKLGIVDPLETDDGIRCRLFDLGYDAKDDFAEAIRTFQKKEGLTATGNVDDTTRTRLKERFGQ
jgi:hypothetical protein